MAVTPPWLPGFGPDSIPAGQTRDGIVLQAPEPVAPAPQARPDNLSWVYLTLALLFCVIGFRLHNNSRCWGATLNDLLDTRERHNVFDETARETSFLVLMNIVWCASAGVLLWESVQLLTPDIPWFSFSITGDPALGIAICAGMCAAYNAVMLLAYWVVGNVFTDTAQTGSWVRGAAAANALEAVAFFPLALMVLVWPQWTPILLICAASVLSLGKILFIFKGFRIFFSGFASLLLFLYYLCSLEIVPLLLTYVLTLEVCTIWL